MPVGLPGRLSKGAGTHLASWLQETTALTAEEGQALLDGTARPAAARFAGSSVAFLFMSSVKCAGASWLSRWRCVFSRPTERRWRWCRSPSPRASRALA